MILEHIELRIDAQPVDGLYTCRVFATGQMVAFAMSSTRGEAIKRAAAIFAEAISDVERARVPGVESATIRLIKSLV